MGKHETAPRSQAGFTLVELAVVMIIIGLLIGGVLKGQELIANAQVTATVAQTKGIDAATSTFRDVYDALPGDMAAAVTRLPNCAAPCANGDGDTRLELDPGAVVVAASEQANFFTHLAAADLITGVSSAPAAPVDAGDEVPEAEISGASIRAGFVGGALPTGATAAVSGAVATWRNGHYLGIGVPPTVAFGVAAGLEALSPTQASRLDNKIDDGQPATGVVRAGGNAGCVAAPDYNTASSSADCSVFIRIQG